MGTLESFQQQYDVTTKKVAVGDRGFSFFLPESLDNFIDPQDVFHDFPLWAKLWEASLVLADYTAGLHVEPDKNFLEIGCGLGMVGIVASSFGHNVTMTEYNPDALNFARANALLNNSSTINITALDWSRPQLQGSFDTIMGSEIIYREEDFNPISNLFKAYLKPGGEIILAEGIRKTGMAFMQQMSDSFHITAQKKILRSKDKEIRVMLCRMKPK